MLQCLRKSALKNSKKTKIRQHVESYHSYPDPTEVPEVSSTVSSFKKTCDKSSDGFSIDQKFRLDRSFTSTQTKSAPGNRSRPEPASTTISNGIVVSSIDTPGLMTSFSLLVQTGSAFEIQQGVSSNTGAVQTLELCAFRSTRSRTHEQLTSEIGQLGGAVQCIASREGLYYCVDVLRDNLSPAMDILADTILNPTLSDDEIEECKEIIVLQQTELPTDMFSKDAVMIAAYKGSPMGNTHYCPNDNIDAVNRTMLNDYRKKHFVGGNTFITAAGIEHEVFLDLVDRKFKNYPSGEKSTIKSSVFVGGMHAEQRVLKEPVIQVAMAFEVGGFSDPMLVPASVLQQLLGGGSSFSAGGPGKGMYTRLYREELNRNMWLESAEAFMAVGNDCGLFGIDASSNPEYAPNLVRMIVAQLIKAAYVPVSQEELGRAKKMLKSRMMMQLESRIVVCEDLARQYAAYGYREDPASICEKVDSVTEADLMAVAQRLLLTPPAVGCVGQDISRMPSYEQILDFTTRARAEAAKKTMIF